MNSAELKGFFITGTDTDVGKTYTCRILAEALSKTVKVTYVKPVQTGCTRNQQGDLQAPDFEYMLQGPIYYTGSYHSHVPYRFEPACSPHLAARLAGKELSLDHIAHCIQWVAGENGQTGWVLVEGAGGVLAPLNASTTMVDLMGRLGFPVVLVTTPKLGTINHTFLSINALREKGVALAGVVMNNCLNIPEDFIYKDNVETVKNATAPLPFLELPFNSSARIGVEKFCDGLTSRRH